MKKITLFIMIAVLSISMIGCSSQGENSIVVGGKDYTEQDILVQLYSELIEANTDLKVERKAYLGGSSVVAKSLDTGDIDMYVEYTGTALISVLNEKAITDSEEVYKIVKSRYENEKGIKWLDPIGFNNTFAITMKRDKADELGIKTLSDLSKHSDQLTFASTQEFLEREDGYDNFKEVYNIDFKDVKGMDPGLCYTAVDEGHADVNVSFATDGRIPAFDLIVLEDDKSFFPPYDAAPLVRTDVLDKYPELEETLNMLANKITDEEMAKLNAQVDLEQKDAVAVAKKWLEDNGFIK